MGVCVIAAVVAEHVNVDGGREWMSECGCVYGFGFLSEFLDVGGRSGSW